MSVLRRAECHVTLANEDAFFLKAPLLVLLQDMSTMLKQLLHTVLHTVVEHFVRYEGLAG